MSTGCRVILGITASMALLCAASDSALAQRGRGFGFGPNRAQLATLKEVHVALKMTEEQIQAAKEAADQFNRDVSELFMSAMGNVEKVRTAMPALHEKATTAINTKLDEAQRKKLTEFYIQQNGVNSVFDPQVKTLLRLTDEQLTKLQAARTTNREEGAKATRKTPKGEMPADRTARFEKLWKEAEDRILMLLTERQNETFKKLRGEEVQIDLRPLFPPPPGSNSNRSFSM
jgi:hypothetical protein